MPPDILLMGHIVKDITPRGWRLGGTVAYAAAQAARLGLDVAAVTSCSPDVSPAEALPMAHWHVVPSAATTSFDNRYTDGRREQWVTDVARALGPAHIPPAWCRAPLVLLGPVCGELDPEVGTLFPPTSHVGLCAQGWLRRLEDGKVVAGQVEPDAAWLVGDTVFVSKEDVDDPEGVAVWQRHVPTVILTRGARGCTVWDAGGRHDIDAFDVEEVDATGAGDVFAAAYMVRIRETGDTLSAARFASAAAALSVRGAGIEAVAAREQIETMVGLERGVSRPWR